MTTLDLNPDTPHDPDRTRLLADTAVGIVRALNYATMAGRGGIAEPSDVYDLLGALAPAAEALPQLCEQVAAWLDAEQSAGRLAETTSGRYGGDSHKAVTAAGSALAEAARAADKLSKLLREAQNTVGGVRPADVTELPCPDCNGRGLAGNDEPCLNCGGTGWETDGGEQ